MNRPPEDVDWILRSWLHKTVPPERPLDDVEPHTAAWAALAMLRLREREDEIADYIRAALPRSGSAATGAPQAQGLPDKTDLNPFGNCALVPIVAEYADRLPQELLAEIERTFRLKVECLASGPGYNYCYTNMFLAENAPCLVMAERVGTQEQIAAMHRQWLTYYDLAVSRGIQERQSDAYATVSLIALSVVAAYSSQPDCRNRALELFTALAREIRFHGNRFPIPARRTYNNIRGTARKYSAMDWLLGDCPKDPRALPEWMGSLNHCKDDHDWFHHMAPWLIMAAHTFPKIIAPEMLEPGGAPRSISGKYVEQVGWTAYYHPRYSLGAFAESPAGVAAFQHESDLPVAFSGDEQNLAFFGAYVIDHEGNTDYHPGGPDNPGIKEFGPRIAANHPEVRFANCQEHNVLVTIIDIEKLRGNVDEVGISLRAPDWTGTLIDSAGKQVTAEQGQLPGEWAFLELGGALAGIRPLEIYDGKIVTAQGSLPSLRYRIDSESGLWLFAPIIAGESGVEVTGSQSGGFVCVLLGESEGGAGWSDMLQRIQGMRIEEELYLDGFLLRDGFAEGERRIKTAGAGWDLEVGYDMRRNSFTYRRFNGHDITFPSALNMIQPGAPELQP